MSTIQVHAGVDESLGFVVEENGAPANLEGATMQLRIASAFGESALLVADGSSSEAGSVVVELSAAETSSLQPVCYKYQLLVTRAGNVDVADSGDLVVLSLIEEEA